MAPTAVGYNDRAERGGKVSSSCEQSKRIRGCAADLLFPGFEGTSRSGQSDFFSTFFR